MSSGISEFNGEVRSISYQSHGSGRMINNQLFQVVLYPHVADLAHPLCKPFVHTYIYRNKCNIGKSQAEK